MKRPNYQLVWWGIFRKASWWPLVTWHPFKSECWREIYLWSVCIGPLEIRRWNWSSDNQGGAR